MSGPPSTVDDHRARPSANAAASNQKTLLKYAAIINNASVGIAFTKDRAFQHANRAFEELFDWPAGGLVGQPGQVVWGSQAENAEVGSAAGPLLMQGKSVELERRMMRRTGERFWCRRQARSIDPVNPARLLSYADAAMYHAKSSGRHNVQYYAATMCASLQARLQLETDLHHAISRAECELFYQPRIDFASGQINGYEALLRWHHPESGLIAPGVFIPIAEESGLILPIGEWVITEACQQMKRWDGAGYAVKSMAVNLSARQFLDRKLAQQVRAAIDDAGLDPARLEFEITESILMVNTEETIAVFAELRALGVKLSIDDFGTGFSSLAYLKRFHVDNLKIDHSFVRDIGTDPDSAAIVRAIVNMAQSLQLRVVAEGVETREQYEYLAACGCEEAQGYYFARPRPAADIVPRLTNVASWLTTGQ